MSLDFSLIRCGAYEDGEEFSSEVFSAKITHNLNTMADAVGIYNALWHPYEHYGENPTAKDIIEVLEKGLAELKSDPDKYKQFDSPNGWGLYEHFVPWVEKVLTACKKYPNAAISVSI